MKIGICGKSGSGKSSLAKLIMDKYPDTVHIDIDKIGHEAYLDHDVLKKMLLTFGVDVLTDSVIDRKKLGKLVFDNPENMQKLTNITWPYMKSRINEILSENQDKIIIFDWLLLPKTDFFNMCDVKILLDIPREERMKRCIERDHITEEEFLMRDSSSISYNKENFDVVINNNDFEMENIFKLIKHS